MRSHKENSQVIHKCTECDLLFGKRDELVAHASMHATENLICPLCKIPIDEVSEHIKQHTEGEQFACEFCDLIFLTETQLHEHSDTQHLEEIELYDLANTNEESLDGTVEYAPVKRHTDEIIEYTEHVEVITPEEMNDVSKDLSPKSKPANRSYGKVNAKSTVKTVKTTVKLEKLDKDDVQNSSDPVRSPNTRASVTKNTPEKSTDKSISTRSSKSSPSKSITPEKTPTIVAPIKKVTTQASLTKFLTIKPNSNEQSDPNTPTLKKLIPLPTLKTANKDEAKVTPTTAKIAGNKLVKVKQIRMTKAQIEALTKEGRIEMRGNQVIIKKEISPKKK